MWSKQIRIAITAATGLLALTTGLVINASAAGTPVAVVGKYTMTAEQARQSVALLEFVAERKLAPKDARFLTTHTLTDFRNHPAETLRETKLVQAAMPKWQRTQGAERAKVRKRLLKEMYFRVVEPEPKDRAYSAKYAALLSHYTSILAADLPSRLVVTEKDARAMAASNNLVGRLTGQTSSMSLLDIHNWLKDDGFAKYSPAERAALATAEIRWASLQSSWANSSPSERRRLTAKLRSQVHHPQQVMTAARNWESSVMRQHGA